MKKIYIFLVILAFVLLGGGIGTWYYYQQMDNTLTLQPIKSPTSTTNKKDKSSSSDQQKQNFSSASVPIRAKYESKIVYTSKQNVDIKTLQRDCKERGGEFNECGSVCGPQANTCTSMCAYTCELDKNTSRNNNFGKWRTYTNKKIGFSMDYPSALKVEESPTEPVKFTLLGPTQREGTEIFDGISIIITTATHTQENLRDYIDSRLKKTGEIGKVTQKPERVVLNGNNGYRYEKVTVGSSTVLTFPLSEKRIIKLSYSAPDPKDRGYQKIAREMIKSFKLLHQNQADSLTVNLYYNKTPAINGDACSSAKIMPVERTLEGTTTPIQDTIELLLEGNIKSAERQKFRDSQLSLKKTNLEKGVLTLEFNDPDDFTVGGSCRIQLLKTQIKKTANQFFSVDKVEITPATLFQP